MKLEDVVYLIKLYQPYWINDTNTGDILSDEEISDELFISWMGRNVLSIEATIDTIQDGGRLRNRGVVVITI